MNLKRKTAILLMIIAIVVTMIGGCKGKDSSGEKEPATKSDAAIKSSDAVKQTTGKGAGRFFENEVSLPKGIRDIMALRKLSDGSLAAVDENRDDYSYYILKSTDKGEKWKKTQITGLKGEYVPCIAISPSGEVALINYAKDGKVDVNLSDEQGKTKEFSFSFPEKNKDNQVRQAAYGSDGKLIVSDTGGSLYTVSTDGTCSKAFDTEGASVNYFGIAGDTLLAVHDEGIMLFDTNDGKMSGGEELLDDLVKKNTGLRSSGTDTGYPMVFSEGIENNSIMFANENGIFHFTKGGNIIEQLFDGSSSEIGAGNVIFQDLAVLDKENIFIAANSDGNDKILHYSYDKAAVSVPDKELTVYALDESDFLRKAVTIFQKKNPDIHVNLEFALSGEDGVTLDDALSTLNTNILAHKGPDVLILDGMPADSYIEKGMLEDISDVVEDVDNQDGVFKNIKEGSRRDGKIYAMPARFLISIVEGDKAAVKSGGNLSSFAEMAEKVKKKYPSVKFTSNKGPRSVLRDLYYADSATWKSGDGTVDSKMLSDYLTYAKRIYDLDKTGKNEDNLDELSGDGTLGGYKGGTNMDSGLISNEWKVAFGSLGGFEELQTLCSARKQTKADYGLLNSEKVKSYIPYLILGVTAGGNTDAAKDFVKTVLGKKAGNNDSNGFPVNRSAFDKQGMEMMDSQRVKDGVSVAFGGSGDGDKVYGYNYANLTQADVDKITKIAESLTKPAMTNRVIQEFVLGQGEKYLLGEQSLESTVDAILKKVNLYLSE